MATPEAQSPLTLTTPVRSPDTNAQLSFASISSDIKPTTAPAVNTAMVSSCAERWYWRSLLEEMGCGFSGQGWFN